MFLENLTLTSIITKTILQTTHYLHFDILDIVYCITTKAIFLRFNLQEIFLGLGYGQQCNCSEGGNLP